MIDKPIFSVKPASGSKDDKDKAELMNIIMQHLVPRSKQEEILRIAMLKAMTEPEEPIFTYWNESNV